MTQSVNACGGRIGTGPLRARTEVIYVDLGYWTIPGSVFRQCLLNASTGRTLQGYLARQKQRPPRTLQWWRGAEPRVEERNLLAEVLADHLVKASGLRIWGSGYRFEGSGFMVEGLGFRVQDLGVRV